MPENEPDWADSDPLLRRVRAFVSERKLARPNAARALPWLLLWLLSWGAAVVAIATSNDLTVQVLLGTLLIFWVPGAGAVLHESVHSNVVPLRSAHAVLGTFGGLLMGFPYGLWKPFHLEHHRHAVSERDPEGPKFAGSSVSQHLKWTLTGGALSPIFFFQVLVDAARGRGPAWLKNPSLRRTALGLGGAHYLALATLLALALAGQHWLFWAFFLPHLSGLLFWAPFLLTSEHFDGLPGPIETNTCSVRSNWLFRFLFWNTNYHVEHHLVPQVPAHQLPLIHELVKDQVKVFSGYFSFHRGAIATISGRSKAEALAETR